MVGLYEGLEEVGFKRAADGYVFQTNNRWFIGPKRRYLVTEAQKAEIAACIRDTLRVLKPFVLAAAGQSIGDFRGARPFDGAMFRPSLCHQPEFWDKGAGAPRL